jgi:hypothetical protein
MSDGTAPPAPPSSGESAPLPTPAPRPATAKRDAPAARPSKVKAFLVVGIIISTLVLSGLIVFSLVRSRKPQKEVRNVAAEWANSFQKAKLAFKDTFAVEAKVWTKGENLTSEDLEKIRAGLKVFREANDKFHELNKLVLDQGKGPSKETQEMGSRLPELKLWILDAAAIVEGDAKPPEYGGLYIPMYLTVARYDKTVARLKQIQDAHPEIIQRNDKEEWKRTRQEIMGLEGEFSACQEKFGSLVDYVREGLSTPDMPGKDLQDLGDLLKYASDSQMARKQGSILRSKFLE